ncbi:cytoskeletal protein RodZ [Tritonibacter multivorans]|uniref:Cytoskeletal protein RodZ n=1 Tax=Tritonibacter multivorans TaxID=928856 RepID=A0A0P1GG53_9RHOB|nr:helix-turn-helix domain-containing protein [Tritonibacter multivorans]MDA7420874.1 DUF4115 domain-containing protein [Tritonibacter multivorans]CUH80582.1 cytoskeletal protein RodZ [Tritonibacter multivorans]SFC83810.1 protein RodZ, contains Xre-like HTH and DUF4115 domains [Tritonibacter multivorans]
MIGRFSLRRNGGSNSSSEPKSFDDFELRLGDVMRGERATMGKSLLDVQRELRIKASYIAAIENCDPTVFDTPGFIAGYVRSYARYLGMDAEECFRNFCIESGFEVAHGMSVEASGKKPRAAALPAQGGLGSEAFAGTPFLPADEGIVTRIEPRAVGSLLVLLAVIGGIGYGGWQVLRQVQQVTFAPVEQTPDVLADLDPLEGVVVADAASEDPATEALNRLYRPQALDVPVLVARDAPIATLDPRDFGNFTGFEQLNRETAPSVLLAEATVTDRPVVPTAAATATPQVVEAPAPGVQILAVRPSWVQVKTAGGTVLFETIMEPGQTYDVPASDEPHIFGTGESSGIYFAVNGAHYGPVGPRGQVTKRIDLAPEALSERFQIADLEAEANEPLATMVAQLRAQTPDSE